MAEQGGPVALKMAPASVEKARQDMVEKFAKAAVSSTGYIVPTIDRNGVEKNLSVGASAVEKTFRSEDRPQIYEAASGYVSLGAQNPVLERIYPAGRGSHLETSVAAHASAVASEAMSGVSTLSPENAELAARLVRNAAGMAQERAVDIHNYSGRKAAQKAIDLDFAEARALGTMVKSIGEEALKGMPADQLRVAIARQGAAEYDAIIKAREQAAAQREAGIKDALGPVKRESDEVAGALS